MMKVKKRTVWFITLLSLVAVITVYYGFDRSLKFDGLAIFSDNTLKETSIDDMKKGKKTPVTAQSHLFEEMRMEMLNERSQLRTQLTDKIGSEKTSVEEKNKAYTEMDQLIKRESAESMLEMLIQSLGYSDTLVRTQPGKVMVTVMSDELSKAQANEIIYLVKKEWSDARDVIVDFKTETY